MKDYAKLGVSRDAENVLNQILHVVNDGFHGGKVSKADLLSWIILFYEQNYFRSTIERIRAEHFDRLSYLTSVLEMAKKAKRGGSAAFNLDEALKTLAGDQRKRCSSSSKTTKLEVT